MRNFAVILCLVAATSSAQESPTPAKPPFLRCPCVNCQQRAEILHKIAIVGMGTCTLGAPGTTASARGYASPPVTAAPSQQPLPRPYPFWPQAGTIGNDLCITNYVDLTHGTGQPLDWNGTQQTYSGHTGIDCVINSFNAQALGVPIYAALDGIVALTHDGEIDTNTVAANVPANYVVLWHGNTHYTIYYHIKKGSVAVVPGEYVRAGTVIGMTGSSGSSTSPHLHFESIHGDGSPAPQAVFEPFAGVARPGPSYWVNQPAQTQGALYVRDVLLTSTPLPTYQDDAPRTGTFSAGLQSIYFNFRIGNIPANTTALVRIFKPNGEVLDQFSRTLNPFGARNLGIATDGYESKNDYTQPGAWTVRYDLNGQTVVTAPFQVVTGNTAAASTPAALTAEFDPSNPNPGDVLFCRITGPALKSPDYHLLAYHYLWSVNGAAVRDVTTAALSDALPAGNSTPGAVIACSVNAVDGALNGPVTSVNATVADTLPSLAIESVFIAPGSSAATFMVNLSRPGSAAVSVDFGTADGTAAAGSDYARTTGRLQFPPQTTTQTISVPLLNPGANAKAFSVCLLNPASAWLAVPRAVAHLNASASSATQTLSVDSLAISPNPATVGESVTFSAVAENPNGDALAWTWDFGDGTSLQGNPVTGTYTAAGAFTARATVSDGQSSADATQLVNVYAPIQITKLTLSFDLAARGKDALLIQGKLPALAIPNGAGTAQLTLGNYTAQFALAKTAQRAERMSGKSFSLSGNAKRQSPAGFTARLRNQDLFTALANFGFGQTPGTKMLTLPVELSIGGVVLRQDARVQYTVPSGNSTPRAAQAKLAQ